MDNLDPDKIRQVMNQLAAAFNPSKSRYLDNLKSKRDSLIAAASRLTTAIDYIESHPDVIQFMELMDKLDREDS